MLACLLPFLSKQTLQMDKQVSILHTDKKTCHWYLAHRKTARLSLPLGHQDSERNKMSNLPITGTKQNNKLTTYRCNPVTTSNVILHLQCCSHMSPTRLIRAPFEYSLSSEDNSEHATSCCSQQQLYVHIRYAAQDLLPRYLIAYMTS